MQFALCFIHAFLWNCSHDVMGLDAICNVLTLESHIAITQNRYGTIHVGQVCITRRASHCVNSVINNHTIQLLYLKNRSRKSHSERVLTLSEPEIDICFRCLIRKFNVRGNKDREKISISLYVNGPLKTNPLNWAWWQKQDFFDKDVYKFYLNIGE